MKEEQLLEKRLIELSKIAYHRNIFTYTDFLNLNERNILHTLPKDKLYSRYVTFGGYDLAERQMVAFIPDALSLREENLNDIDFPYVIIKILPLQAKFSEQLTHRDYLGAILNLGIDRSKIGDILIKEKETIVFIHRSMSDFLCNELTRIKHTSVYATVSNCEELDFTPNFEEITGTVASVRLDSLLSLAFSSSRSKLSGLIEGAKVFVNGKLMTTNSYQVKEGDIISVRGMGKFKFNGSQYRTKKNREFVSINKYI